MSTFVIHAPKRFDFGQHNDFRDACSNAFKSTITGIEVDFRNTEYLDSSALGMLLMLRDKATDKHINVTIINVSGAALDVLKIANFSKLFTIIP